MKNKEDIHYQIWLEFGSRENKGEFDYDVQVASVVDRVIELYESYQDNLIDNSNHL